MQKIILTRTQVRACDEIAVEQFAMPSLLLMENAGAGAAAHILKLLIAPHKAQVLIAAGVGNNAGDGFVVARHLTNAAVKVKVILCGDRTKYKDDAAVNLGIIERMQLPLLELPPGDAKSAEQFIQAQAQSCNLLVDALLGTGTSGPPREPIRSVIRALNSLNQPVVALDIPSGMDCDTGCPLEVAVQADYTITFAARKKGFENPQAQNYTGEIIVVPIGIHTSLLTEKMRQT